MSLRGGPRRGGYGGGGDARRGGGGHRDMTCFKCGKPGHRANECPDSGGSAGRRDNNCFKCGKPGHRANECPTTGGQQRGGGDRRDDNCFNCGQSGHRKFECPNSSQQRSGDRQRGDDRSYGGRGRGSRGGGRGGYADRPSTSGGGYGGDQQSPKRPSSSAKPYSPKERECRAESQFVARPGVGTLGHRIELIVNHFRLVINDIVVYQYDIKFDCATRTLGQAVAAAAPPTGAEGGGGDRESRQKVRKLRQKENRQVFNEFMANQPQLFRSAAGHQIRPVFDGNSNFYTRWPLSDDEFTCNITVQLDGGNPMTVKVTIKEANRADLSAINLYYDGISPDVPREAMQALDIILRYGPTSDRIPIGNSLYPKWMANNPLANRQNIDGIKPVGNKQVVFGHYQSSRLTKMGPTILVDRSATAFFTGGPLLDFIRKLNPKPTVDIKAILRQSKGLRVYTTHLTYKRRYTIKDFSKHSPDRQTFECQDENGRPKMITVKEYFKKEYNIDIMDTKFPCLIPQANKPIYLPIEVCELFPDQPVSRVKLDSFNTQQMVRTCGGQTPAERFDEIQEAVETINRVSAPYLQEFEISIDTRPVQIPGRVLDQPAIKGLDRKLHQKMRTNIELRSWVLVNLCYDVSDQHINEFVGGLRRASPQVGTTVGEPVKVLNHELKSLEDIEGLFQKAGRECQRVRQTLQLIMFIIPDDTAIYSTIKRQGDCIFGISTQCVKSKNVSNPPKGGIQSNLLLKINTKLGGVNRILERVPDLPEVLSKPGHRVMIIGADVTHPAPADKLETSVAACIGSIDRDYCKYTGSVRAQERTTRAQAVEMIKEFDIMIGELLVEYEKSMKSYPNHIIYYRDGVSESQFKDVMEYERRKLLEGCKSKGFTPKVTFVTVQKRHHTRMRPADPANGYGRMGNVPPGTTADTHIVHPADFDFYLCSHEGIQGTSRPTHYYVLHDDYKFTADELQKLSYYLCHIYARTDKPISLPVPVQYAHLVAFRARNHIVADNESSAASGGTGDRREVQRRDETDEDRRHREDLLVKRLNELIKINDNIKNLMYFC